MASITEILATDSPSSSLGDINTNFTNLNTDKIEANDVKTLTNKTFDADGTGNALSNVDTDNIKTAAKTGIDTKVVTGTDGTADNLTKWNSDGDLVDAGASLVTTSPASTSVDTTITSSKAIYDYVNTSVAGFINEMFIYPAVNTAGSTANAFTGNVNTYRSAVINASQGVGFNFRVPSNFTSITSMVVVTIPDASETLTYDLSSTYAGAGQANNTYSETVSNATLAVTSGEIEELDVSGAFTALSAGDYCGLQFDSDTADIRVIGLYFKYAV